MENLGFRCAADVKRVKKKPEVQLPLDVDAAMLVKTEDDVTTKKPEAPKRAPRKHFYNETWAYKVKQVLSEVVSGDIKDAENVLHRLRGKGAKKDEL